MKLLVARRGLSLRLLCGVGALLCGWGCARAQQPAPEPRRPDVLLSSTAGGSKTVAPDRPPPAPLPPPTPQQRAARLRERVLEELAAPEMARTRSSVLVLPVAGGDSLVSVEPDALRVPASNAKLLTSLAALRTLPGKYRFVTEYYLRGGKLYIWGTGDPALRRRELASLGAQLRAHGVNAVRGIVIDDSFFDRRRRLAPGFESFGEGAYYRPTSGALNVNGNAITVKVSAPRKGRKRPRVDVYPPSDYVKVHKLVRFAPRKGKGAGKKRISVQIRPRGAIMWVTVSGTIVRGHRPWRTRRAVYDPGLATGWAVRRALVKAGVKVSGNVWRGRRPRGATPVLRRVRSLGAILAAVNTHSDNLAAESLVRAMGSLDATYGQRAGSWERGLLVLQRSLEQAGLSGFWLGNGSGLHRHSWVTAHLMTDLLRKVHSDEKLRQVLLPTLSVAGRSGTLAKRMRGTAAEEVVMGKTGTLGGALALSGYADPDGTSPLVFSILINGRSDHAVRHHIDRIAVLLARHARGLPLAEEPASQPASQPATQPASQPASQPTDDDDEVVEDEDEPQSQDAPVK